MNTRNYLSKDQTVAGRAILCLMVIFGHCFDGILEYTGSWAVAVFFFLSGYSLALTSEKAEVNSRFILRKFKNIIIPFALVAILYHLMFYKYPVVNDYNSISGLVKAYLNFTPTVQAGWYIEMLLLLFVSFFVSYAISKGNRKKQLILMLIMHIVVVIYVLVFTTSYWTILSPQCFILGSAYYYYKDKIETKLLSSDITDVVMLLVTMISIVCCVLSGSVNGIFSLVLQFISYTLAPFVALFISSRVNFKTRILIFLGKQSFWMYLVHVGIQYFVTTAITPGFMWPSVVFFLITAISSLVIGSCLKFIYDHVFYW